MISYQDLLKAVPFEVKQGAKYVYGLMPTRFRYGALFFKSCKEAEEREKWPLERFAADQDEKLRRLVQHAYAHVPYYRKLFDSHGISPRDINSRQDMVRIPPLTKDELRANFADLAANNINKRDMVLISTSGTSGRPVRFYSERRHETYLDGDAYRWRHFRWGGCTPYDLRATLGAQRIAARRNGQRRISLYDPMTRRLVLSAYDINNTTLDQYADVLQHYKPPYLHGFPSALEALTRLLQAKGIPSPAPVKAIFTQSEVLYPWQRDRIEKYFSCKIFDWYGMEERVIAAAECEHHTDLHTFPDYCIVEILQGNNTVTGEEGEIVSTRLDNYAMPLIRYRTGDIGMIPTGQCPCGRNMPLLRLSGGRDRNFLVAKNGGLISITVVDIPKATAHIEQFQFIQDVPGAVLLKIVKKSTFTEHDLSLVHRDLTEKFGEMVDVTIEFVESLERTKRGKLPLLLQKLNLDHHLCSP